MGGIVTFVTDTRDRDYYEGYYTVTIPFDVIDAQVSAFNITDAAYRTKRENAFLRLSGRELTIYGWFIGSYHRTMSVKWSVKGIQS